MQNWKKLGKIFDVGDQAPAPWRRTHAAVPTVEKLAGEKVRVYFGSRNDSQQASIGSFVFDPRDPHLITEVSDVAHLGPGDLGTFDDSGLLPSWITQANGQTRLYYIGWNLGVTVPFRNMIGLAVRGEEGGDFRRYSRAPIGDRDEADPLFYTNPCVLFHEGIWKMWYLSAVKWVHEQGKLIHYYHLKYDESSDGIRWNRKPVVAIDFHHPGEFAISRPCVLIEEGVYKMWYSYRAGPRSEAYRIGYAESPDGKNWQRLDGEVGLEVSGSGWESEMIEYGCVFDHADRRYMLYNGNGFGKTGIGLAILENS